MLRCYLMQQPIPSMKSLKSSDMITSYISVGIFHKLKGYSPREYRKLRNKFWNPQRGYHRIIKTMICGILFSLLLFLFYKLTPCSPYISATSYKEICFLSPAFRILFVGYYLPPLPASHTTCFPATLCHHRPQTVAYRTLHFSWLRLPFSQIGYSLGRILYPNLILHSLSPQVATSEWFLYKMLPHLPDLYHRGVLLQSLQSAWMVRRYRTPYRKISRQPSPACFLQLLLLTGMPHCHHRCRAEIHFYLPVNWLKRNLVLSDEIFP